MDLANDAQTVIPSSELFPIQVPKTLFQIVFPTVIRQVGDRTDFVQEEPLDLQCLTMIWATCVVEDVSIHLDILTSDF